MVTRLRDRLTPPAFDDAGDERSAALINAVTIVGAAGAIPGAIATAASSDGDAVRLAVFATLSVACIATNLVMRSGRVRPAAAMLTIVAFVALTVGVFRLGGVRSIPFLGLVLLIAFASFTLGAPAGALTGAATAAVLVIAYLAELDGAIDFATDANTSRQAFVARMIGVAIFVALISLWTQQNRRAFHELHDRERDLQRTADELDELQRFNQRILEQSMNAVYVVDAVTRRPTHVNAQFTAATGYSIEQLDAMPIDDVRELIHPEDRTAVERAHATVRESARRDPPVDVEFRYRCSDGRTTTWLARVAAFRRGADGRPIEVMISATDITDLRETESVRRELQEFNERVLDASKSVVYISDAETGVPIHVNREFTSRTGYTLDDLRAMSLDDLRGLIHPDDREHVDAARREMRESPWDRPAEFEFRYRSRDGDWRRWLARDSAFVRDDDGRVVQNIVSGVDVTDLHRSQVANRELERFNQRVIDLSASAIYITAPGSGAPEYVSPAYVSMTGRTLDDLIAMSSEERRGLVHPDDRATVDDARRRVVAADDDQPVSHEFRFRRADGEWRSMLAHLAPFRRDDAGAVTQTIVSAIDVTDLKIAEAANQELELFNQLIVETAISAIYITDAATSRPSFVNPQFVHLTGQTLDDLLSADAPGIRRRTHPDDLARVSAARATVLASKPGDAPVEFEFRYRTSERGWLWLLGRVGVFRRRADGSVAELIVSMVDVSDLKIAEAEIRELQLFSEAVIEHSASGMLITAPDGSKPEYVSPEFTRIGGYTLDDLLAMSEDDRRALIHPDDREAADAARRRLVEEPGDAPIAVELRYHHKDGHWVDILGRYGVFRRSDAGEVLQTIATSVDITALRAAQAALRRSEEFGQRVLELSSNSIYIHDVTLNLPEFVSGAYVRSTGYSLVDLHAMTANERDGLIHPGDADAFAIANQRVVATPDDGPVDIEFRYRKSDGSWIQLMGKVAPFRRADDGSVTHVIVSSTDVSELKAAQRSAQESLAALSSALTDVEHRRRAQERANRHLQRANAELEQFVYIASHDLQEPVRTVGSFADLLSSRQRDRLDERGQRALDYIQSATERMSDLIRSLLDYSRLGQDGPFDDVDLSEVIEQVLDDLGPQIAETGARVECEMLPTVRGSAPELRSLFQNLISNAIKFARPDDLPDIAVASQRTDGGWVFRVSDNGIGIAPQHHERVFQIFQQLDRESRASGSGIGLAHCKKIIELHGGRIWIASEPGLGTTFHFNIPDPAEDET